MVAAGPIPSGAHAFGPCSMVREPRSPHASERELIEAWELTHAGRYTELTELLDLVADLEITAGPRRQSQRAEAFELLATTYPACSAALAEIGEPDAAWIAADRAMAAAERANNRCWSPPGRSGWRSCSSLPGTTTKPRRPPAPRRRAVAEGRPRRPAGHVLVGRPDLAARHHRRTDERRWTPPTASLSKPGTSPNGSGTGTTSSTPSWAGRRTAVRDRHRGRAGRRGPGTAHRRHRGHERAVRRAAGPDARRCARAHAQRRQVGEAVAAPSRPRTSAARSDPGHDLAARPCSPLDRCRARRAGSYAAWSERFTV